MKRVTVMHIRGNTGSVHLVWALSPAHCVSWDMCLVYHYLTMSSSLANWGDK